jgi:hypothetical protein
LLFIPSRLQSERGGRGKAQRAIAAVTDTGIGRLEVDDLLRELLGRVVELLGADTAAVLFFDEPSGQPVPARRYQAAGLVGNSPTANPPSSKPNC